MNTSKHHDAAIRPVSHRDPNGSEELADLKADGSIPMKYRGTAADQRDMAVLGKKQVLRVGEAARRRAFRNTTLTIWFPAQLQIHHHAGFCEYRHGLVGSVVTAVRSGVG